MPIPIVVIDTQIVLRAVLNERSLPARLLFELGKQYTLAVSPSVRAEVYDVLSRPSLRTKFPALTDMELNRILAVLDAGVQHEVEHVPAMARDPKDDKFLALAAEAKAQFIVSEDMDLLVLNPYQGIRIVNALDFLRVLQALE